MRKALAIAAAGAAILAVPTFAQVGGVADVQVGGQVGGQAGVGPAGTVGSITDRLSDRVDQVDGTVNQAVDDTNLTVAMREQVRAGAEVRDNSGTSIGTIQSVEGDTAVVVRGGKLYNIPLSEIYQDASGRTKGLVTKLSRTEIKARAAAGAQVD